jgi:hypothetical protein
MRKPSFAKKLKLVDEQVIRLRNQLRKKVDSIAIGKAAAGTILDDIARIRAYSDQLDLAIGYRLFNPNISFEQNLARASAILSILGRLTAMLLKQVDRFLNCFGGKQAIAIQQIVSWAGEDPSRGQWLAAFAYSQRFRRRR